MSDDAIGGSFGMRPVVAADAADLCATCGHDRRYHTRVLLECTYATQDTRDELMTRTTLTVECRCRLFVPPAHRQWDPAGRMIDDAATPRVERFGRPGEGSRP